MKKTNLKYRWDLVRLGKSKSFAVDNIKSAQRAAQLYAQRHVLVFKTMKLPDGRLWVKNVTEVV